MMSRMQSKFFRPTGDVKFRITNERMSGVNRVRIEGEVFGARGSTLKHFGSAAEADAFFDAMTEEGAEAWWKSLFAKVSDEFAGLLERDFLYGAGGSTPRGLFNA
ncbi:hypothetical protein [Pseudomonas aeruginosa]|uniref:hypothetical protein n=1 Tax=Pseudomonas aeruginosa TaxID=287 RepID=UPI0003BB2C2C|nr:hypothetical protein [Pseudomonas aeruginosa]ERY86344.1 hypothetical protein Q022_05922 [Pseudomonas aeruginosa BWHPSA009]